MQANLLTFEDIANIKRYTNLFYFASNNKARDEVLLRVTDFIKVDIVLINFFRQATL